ncbi:MAG: ribosomal-processing cysteine protease Prp [Defluviitaleaceae bacterium]|nr:ribosomal-processing cysteine protease Prp [Defluviitaleaceae bacterium]
MRKQSIKVVLFYNKNGHVYGFDVANHGDAIICAGVSALVITCVNFIESRFKGELTLKYKTADGHIAFEIAELKQGKTHESASLIIDSMVFGLAQIQSVHKKQIKIYTRKSD